MADSIAVPVRSEARAFPLPAIPWFLWAAVAGTTLAMVGLHWDISWHRSIGRDTFWTPPHMAIYLCGVIAGAVSAYLILGTTFGALPEIRAASVRMWGFHGPLGAFLMAWGGVAMLVSAPFDNWWHNAYGLDVKILSPPHAVLAAGFIGIEWGSLLLVLGYMNRAHGEERLRLTRLFLYIGSMILVATQIMSMEYSFRVLQHTATFYWAVAIPVPVVLFGIAHASEHRWGATIMAGIYTLFTLSLIWILPRFPAQPKLGPVYNPVTVFVPPDFPLLLIVPAIAIDLLRGWFQQNGAPAWLQAVIGGPVFIAVFAAVQWPFGSFLLSPAATNSFFGTIYHDYSARPQSFQVRGIFVQAEPNFWSMMALAVAVAMVTTCIGLAWGSWMRRLRR
jgi:hypothetical protein